MVKELVDDGQRSVNQPGSARCDDVNSNHHEPSATCVKRSSVDEFKNVVGNKQYKWKVDYCFDFSRISIQALPSCLKMASHHKRNRLDFQSCKSVGQMISS